jgi:branched-chain amino acid transport system permease protein
VAVGALALAAAEVVILTQTSGLWVDAISFGLIIAVLVLRPRGLFGKKEVQRA